MQDLNQSLIVALVTVPTLFGVFRLPKEMFIAVVAISIALAFANLDKIAKFKGGGIFEAEMREIRAAKEDAYAAIEQLKQLGLSLSAPIVDELALSGRMLQYMPLKYKLQRVERIADTLRSLGATQAEIDEATKTIFLRVNQDHVRRIFYELKTENPKADAAMFDGLSDGKFDGYDARAKIEAFIKERNLESSPNVEERILDLEHFSKTHKLRRENDWQS
jgi:hypothetical protein